MQEPHITAALSQDPKMLQAYREGKDLYSVIAQTVFHNKYEDNLEYYPPFTKIVIDGKEIISGDGQEHFFKTDDNGTVEIPACYKVDTNRGREQASDVKIGDILKSEEGVELEVEGKREFLVKDISMVSISLKRLEGEK